MAGGTSPTVGGESMDPSPAEARRGLSRRAAVLTLAAGAVAGTGLTLALRGGAEGSTVATMPDPRATVIEPGIPINPELDGEPLPTDVVLTTTEGSPVLSSSLIGRPLVLNFWFSSCAPCRLEMPEFATVHAQLGDRVRIVGVNTLDSGERAADFARSVGAGYEILVEANSLADRLRLGRYPTTVFVTSDGRITSIQSGEMSADELRARIDEELL